MQHDSLAAPAVTFRVLTPEEAGIGYQVIVDAVQWLEARRTTRGKMWQSPLPRPIYAQRSARGQNYGLFVDGKLAVIASLVSAPMEWSAHIPETNPPWLSTFATSRAFRGQHWGCRMIEEICALLKDRNDPALYLDCGSPFLEDYYATLGFTLIQRQKRSLNRPPLPRREANCALMRREL